MWGFNGGFSCKSFSKLHNDWQSLRRAILEDNEEASSVATFKACTAAISTLKPEWFVLENVDMDGDDPDGNLTLILRVLENCGYKVQTFRLTAKDFGLPQRRVRIYLVGFDKDRQSQASFQRMEKHLMALRLQCQKPAASLFKGPFVLL